MWTSQNDERDRPTQRAAPLSVVAKINIECDWIASETVQMAKSGHKSSNLDGIISLPYEGSQALLNIDGTWVTSKTQRYIRYAKWGDTLQAYCMSKHGWSNQTFESVNWEAVRTVRAGMPLSLFIPYGLVR